MASGVLLETHEALVAGLDPMEQPHPAHTARADLGAAEPELARDALGTVGGGIQSVIEDLVPVGVRALGSAARLERADAPPSVFGD